MDPLSAIGVASAVVQFLSIGLKITQRLSEYNKASPKDVPKSLQSINTQLPLLINALNRVKTDVKVDKIDVDTRCILRGVVSGCTGLVEEVGSIMDRLVLGPGDAFTVKIRKVLASLQNDERIWAIDKNLQTYISVLILHHVIDASEVPPPAPEEKFYFDVREKRVPRFVERDDLLHELELHLLDAARSQVKSPTVVVLRGERGVGKTQLALEYCHQAHSLGQFRTVFWINAATIENLCLGFESIAAIVRQSTEGTRNEKIDFVRKFLGDRWHPWLLVLHEYDHAARGCLLDVLPSRGYGAIILTTCNQSIGHLGTVIHIPKFLNVEEREQLRWLITRAIEDQDFEKIKDAVAQGADVNSLWDDGWICLSRAALHGLENAVRLLLAHGADPHLLPTREPPLHWAAGHGYTSIVQILLDYDDSIGFVPKSKENDAAFQDAAKGGHIDTVRLILNQRNVNINSKDRYGCTALRAAATAGYTAVVNLLLDKGADSGSGAEIGIALIEAARNGHLETVKALCLRGKSDPNTQSADGSTALSHASQLSDHDTYEENGEKIVKFLLDQGADPNLAGRDGGPLHEAALRGFEKVTRLLLEHGADPTQKDSLGFTPLLKAVKYKSPNTLSLLLQVKLSDSAIQSHYVEHALLYAARNGERDAVLSILRVSSINIDAVDSNGSTPLLLAIRGNHVQTARLLVRHKAQQDVPDKDGRLPLLVAAEKGFDLLVKDLLRSCKNPNLKNSNEDTPLCLAAANGHEKTVKQLLEHGADPELTNKFGETPLDLGEEKGHEKVVKLLEAALTGERPEEFVLLQKS